MFAVCTHLGKQIVIGYVWSLFLESVHHTCIWKTCAVVIAFCFLVSTKISSARNIVFIYCNHSSDRYQNYYVIGQRLLNYAAYMWLHDPVEMLYIEFLKNVFH